jgi:APA family basic amino acid/polyamine antiporter
MVVASHAAGRPHVSRGDLLRVLGIGFGIAVVVGGVVGQGIMRTPGIVAGALPSTAAVLVVWLIGGLYTLLGAVCLTELGTMSPEAGGYYVYARRAFGDATGFAVGWTDWLTYGCVLAYASIGMAEFTGTLVPSLASHVTLVALAILVAFVLLQSAGLGISSRFQTWTTLLKTLAFVALVCAAAIWRPASTGTATAMATMTVAGSIAALQAVVITFGGWQGALYFTEEDTDPARNLPRAMIGGVAMVIVIYLLVNAALLAVLPMKTLAESTLPAATAAEAIAGPAGARAITIVSLLTLPPLLNSVLMIGTRILFALGRDGFFWSGAARVNDRGAIGVATLITTATAVLLIATGTFMTLIAMTSCFLAVNYCVCCAGLIRLRYSEPGANRPFRAWGYPWSAWIVVIGAIAFLVGVIVGDPTTAAKAFGCLAAAFIAGLIVQRQRSVQSRPETS